MAVLEASSERPGRETVRSSPISSSLGSRRRRCRRRLDLIFGGEKEEKKEEKVQEGRKGWRGNGRLKLAVPGRKDRRWRSGLLLRSDLHSVPCQGAGGGEGEEGRVQKG